MRGGSVLLGVFLLSSLGCGAAPRPSERADSTGGERSSSDEARERSEALLACRAASPPIEWTASATYDAVLERARAHLASLATRRAVSGDEVQPIADGLWALLDALVFDAETEPLRATAEEAAEGLLRERTVDHAAQAAQTALDAITALGDEFHPATPDPCEGLVERERAVGSRAATEE